MGGDYDYIRKNTNTYMPSFTADVVNSENLRCNEGALNSPAKTYEVKAGDSIGFKLWYNEFIEHPGPGFVYMSKADGDVASYMGDGDWFKVWESGVEGGSPSEDTAWGTWQKDRMTFTIPKDIPDGEYLVRAEHIAIHEAHVGKAQFYMECAQLSISGGGSGTPGPMVKIPGVYSAEDPGIAFDKWSGNVGEYPMPGPAVWSGGGSGSASTSSASTSSNTTESASSGSSSSGSTGASTGASTGSSTGSSSGSSASQAPAASAPASGSSSGASQWGAPAQGQTGASQGSQGGWGSWGGASSGASNGAAPSWGAANTNTWTAQADSSADKRDCAVEYVGGGAARARRSVKA